jgi:hypothetical protein
MMRNEPPRRDAVLSALAILIGLLALSNLSKPIQQQHNPGHAGFVFFGTRLHGAANAVVGPLFGLLLAAYAYGVWTMRAWVLPIAIAYAGYVIVNLSLFTMHRPPDSGGALFGLLYVTIAIGVSSGGAFYLYRHRDRLG